jgi:hypothetical protein
MITITQVKILAESIEVWYYSVEGERLVEGSKKMNVGPTVRMNDALRELTQNLATVFYYGEMSEEWKKTKIVATGFKYKEGDNGDSSVITGKLCLGSGKWIGISSDSIPFDDNTYQINNLDASVKALKQACKDMFFSKQAEQLEIDE